MPCLYVMWFMHVVQILLILIHIFCDLLHDNSVLLFLYKLDV